MDKPVMDPLHLKPITREALLTNLFASSAFRVLFAISVGIAMLLVPITYWAFDNQKPYEFIVSESSIVPTKAMGNDQMIVKWRVEIARQCDGIIRRELFDPRTRVVVAIYDPQSAHKPEAPYFNATFLLPRDIQNGRIGYRAQMEYWCNPLQRIWPIRYSTPELFFEVTK